jgi:hypothetical protein
MSDEIVTLARFANPFAAEMAKNRLAEQGIRSCDPRVEIGHHRIITVVLFVLCGGLK